jgi:hypothetical protein
MKSGYRLILAGFSGIIFFLYVPCYFIQLVEPMTAWWALPTALLNFFILIVGIVVSGYVIAHGVSEL